ncbi:hypothetical protein F383_19704 [Gossypium arboreum]|uniref:Uncharacterized protein n=1 Tax=Gossypium arboreum TaxID=29729 RepID=A0A0B0NM09_GOSAR|nr:hypothetical protein F383_19704 [Gossypium arboreum]
MTIVEPEATTLSLAFLAINPNPDRKRALLNATSKLILTYSPEGASHLAMPTTLSTDPKGATTKDMR